MNDFLQFSLIEIHFSASLSPYSFQAPLHSQVSQTSFDKVLSLPLYSLLIPESMEVSPDMDARRPLRAVSVPIG